MPLFSLGERRVHSDSVFQVQAALDDNAAQKLVDFISGRDFVGNGHKAALSLALSFQLSAYSLWLSAFSRKRSCAERVVGGKLVVES